VKLPKHVKGYVKGGRAYWYFRLTKPETPLPGLPWSPAFMAAYDAALAGYRPSAPVLGASRTARGTVNAAVVAYYTDKTAGMLSLGTGSHAGVRSNVERFRTAFGDLPMRGLQTPNLQKYISALGSAAVQRNMLRAMRHFIKFCRGAGLIAHDPTIGVTRGKMSSIKKTADGETYSGFYTWTEDDAARFERRHPVGTMARAAYELYLNLGVRKSDVVRIGPRYIRDGVLHNFLPQKTSTTGGKRISILLFDETRAAIDALKITGADTYLVNSFGKAFTANGFGNKMREWCDEAGLPKAAASHGLRKLFMIRLVHAGYTAPQIGSLSGHKDLREIQGYIDQFDRQKVGLETSTAFEAVRKARRK
jgi:integrase